ncbi:hypothetical protein B9Z19DRAFT_1068378 [Tuber borchii]|uniref:HMA domain-containing protein n=1 Tax=Tuber borchii TaxID=42251 RepID=A0A2T6ZFL5_TUBBO|nr:hypothetical protein B9Z19DRAFT_1068378 [Tuber borchii]
MARARLSGVLFISLPSFVLSLEYSTSILSFLTPPQYQINTSQKNRSKTAPVNAFGPASCSIFDEIAGRGAISQCKRLLSKPVSVQAPKELELNMNVTYGEQQTIRRAIADYGFHKIEMKLPQRECNDSCKTAPVVWV